MLYYSTANDRCRVGLNETIRRGICPDGGYFMPERIPVIPRAFFNNMADMSLKDIGYVVANTLFGDDFPSADLKAIVADAINFDTPLRPDPQAPGLFALELHHGPSRSYKDFGARFMAHILRRLHRPDTLLNILVATKGDAGLAVANSFYRMPATRVFILYPRGATGASQLAAFTSLGDNIIPLEVRGSFADCHKLVRALVADGPSAEALNLFAANSLSVVRLLPQTIYFFYAYACLLRAGADLSKLIISVPMGNLGNLTAGLIAKRMGLPVSRFIAAGAAGAPDCLGDYLASGIELPRTDNPGIPPNFLRLLELYGHSPDLLRNDVVTASLPLPADAGGLSAEPAIAREALLTIPEAGEATTRLFLDTTAASAGSAAHRQGRHSARPAATIPVSAPILRDFIRSYSPKS